MTTHDIEFATRGQVNARRNYLMGIWAGRMLGLSDRDLADYVRDVMASDFLEPGPQDVVRKVQRDLYGIGTEISEVEVLRQLQMTERSVRAELLTTD
ncbi:ATPase inhibitor subunit zeta [Hoeflea poritis]|uniref:ATPase inhibitor subunit zeta n=1 Tax=Hoeflea poritis TaxID=2993659 RepID=A0ABT4VR45_9HYPH|nr:ATPase inhibitor subunit zeta [Hoeflea poritis]MDA4847171.1 ATPase inhibitor subunit zeta [Hoeflea poritis]